MIGLIIVLSVVAVLVLTTIGIYNSLVKSKNKVENSFANVDVILKKRYDLIPNLVNTVKGYAKHEKETFNQVINLRTSAINANTTNDKVKTNNEITSSIGNIIAIAENYPALKADANFLSLQQSLTDIEGELSAVRTSYNNYATQYNTKIDTFPINIFSKIFGFKKRDLFVVTNAKERENVKVEF